MIDKKQTLPTSPEFGILLIEPSPSAVRILSMDGSIHGACPESLGWQRETKWPLVALAWDLTCTGLPRRRTRAGAMLSEQRVPTQVAAPLLSVLPALTRYSGVAHGRGRKLKAIPTQRRPRRGWGDR